MVIWYASLSVGLQKTERRERHYSQQSAQKNLSVRPSIRLVSCFDNLNGNGGSKSLLVKKTDDCLLYAL